MRIYKIVGIVLSAILLLASCTNSDLEKKKVKIAYANWLEGIAMSHLAKVVLEEHGYEVELQNADLAPIFVSMSGKKSDVFLDAWLPITMKDYTAGSIPIASAGSESVSRFIKRRCTGANGTGSAIIDV